MLLPRSRIPTYGPPPRIGVYSRFVVASCGGGSSWRRGSGGGAFFKYRVNAMEAPRARAASRSSGPISALVKCLRSTPSRRWLDVSVDEAMAMSRNWRNCGGLYRAESFGDVAGRRCGGSSELIAKVEIARCRSGFGKRVDTEFQLDSQAASIELLRGRAMATISSACVAARVPNRRTQRTPTNPRTCEPANPRTSGSRSSSDDDRSFSAALQPAGAGRARRR